MYSLQQVKTGLSTYLEEEILIKITGWKKWVTGAYLSMQMDNVTAIFTTLKSNPVFSTLQVIDAEDNIDVDKLYKYFIEQANKGAVTFDAPVIGTITLHAEDISKLYSAMKRS